MGTVVSSIKIWNLSDGITVNTLLGQWLSVGIFEWVTPSDFMSYTCSIYANSKGSCGSAHPHSLVRTMKGPSKHKRYLARTFNARSHNHGTFVHQRARSMWSPSGWACAFEITEGSKTLRAWWWSILAGQNEVRWQVNGGINEIHKACMHTGTQTRTNARMHAQARMHARARTHQHTFFLHKLHHSLPSIMCWGILRPLVSLNISLTKISF